MSRSSPEFEPAAVPSSDNAPYLGDRGVSDEEFAEWVKRSQADTDAVLEAWDAGIEFHQRVEPDGPEDDEDDEEPADPMTPRGTVNYVARRNQGFMEQAARIAARQSFLERAVQQPAPEGDETPLFGPGPEGPLSSSEITARHELWRRQMEGSYGRTPDGGIGPHPGDGVSWERRDGNRDLYAEFYAELQHERELEAAQQRLEASGFVVVTRAPDVGLATTLGLILPARQTFEL